MRFAPTSILAFALPVALAACVVVPLPGRDASVTSLLIRSDDQQIGTVHLTAVPTGVQVRFAASGLPAGTHAVHVHEVGLCNQRDFASAGAHWNPTGRQHGRSNAAGPHAGDLGNVEVGADGTLTANVLLAGARLPNPSVRGPGTILADADGAALIIHAAADDERTDPSGNSGDRIACAVLAAPVVAAGG